MSSRHAVVLAKLRQTPTPTIHRQKPHERLPAKGCESIVDLILMENMKLRLTKKQRNKRNSLGSEWKKFLEDKFDELINMKLFSLDKLPQDTPKDGGVYLFSSHKTHMYVGRTKQRIAVRLRAHVSGVPDCPLAFRMAVEDIKSKLNDKMTRKQIREIEDFGQAFKDAKDKIKKMEARWVGEGCLAKQAVLELYVAKILDTKYNKPLQGSIRDFIRQLKNG